jgi:alkylation response protein AidB-like acyl-CoA dehydrogenase
LSSSASHCAEESQGGHAEIRFAIKARHIAQLGYNPVCRFDNVRVPLDNILLGEGKGFEIAQGRLGPGRVHHCMRLIGLGSRALNLMVLRASARSAFGKQLSANECVLRDIAETRLKVCDAARCCCMLVMVIAVSAAAGGDASAHAAHGLDHGSLRQQGSCFRVILQLFRCEFLTRRAGVT